MFPVLLLAASLSAQPSHETAHIVIDVRIKQGDPFGSEAGGTVKVQKEWALSARTGRPVMCGDLGEKYFTRANGPVIAATDLVPLGTQYEFLPIARQDGKISLELNTKCATVTDEKGVPSVHEGTSRSIVVLNPAEPLKNRLSARSATDQTWIEIEVRFSEATAAK